MRQTRTLMNRRTVLQLAGGIGTVAIAGCLGVGSSDANNRGDPKTSERGDENHLDEPVAHADVAMKSDDDGHHFDPEVVWIEPGGTITWTNESGSHTTTPYHPDFDKPQRIPLTASPWDSGMFAEAGATFEHTFDVKGVYDYFCVPHEHRAMVGSVLVGKPDPHDQQGLRPPQDSLPSEAQTRIAELNTRTNELLGHTHD